MTLLRRGLLSSNPVQPNLAVSIYTLEAHRAYRLVHPSISIQSLAKALCLSHGIPYQPHLRRMLSDAFDIYLNILRRVDARIQVVLSRTTPDWHLKNSCPSCQYTLEGEDPLKYTLLVAMDGNNSLKRFADRSTVHRTPFKSNFFLSRDNVNLYADEVKSRKKRPGKKRKRPKNDDNSDTTDNSDAEMELEGKAKGPEDARLPSMGDAPVDPDVEGIVSACVRRWKAAADDSKKGMFGCYDESGVFLSVCRHGQVLVAVDMVASGEL